MKKSVIFALLLMGFTSVITQVLLIRELLVTFSGNELSIGLIMANWLILEAIGSSLIGRIAEKTRKKVRAFAILQLIISIFLPVAVYGTRILRNIIGVAPGEEVGLFPVLYCSFFILAPLSLSDGAQFTFGCKIFSQLSKEDAPSIGKVYIYEAIGFIIGGAIFTYLLIPYFHSMQIACGIAVLNLSSALLLLVPSLSNFRFSYLAIVVIVFFASASYLLFSSKTDEIHNSSIREQWKGHNLLYYQNSIYGNVAVTQREEQLTFFADGIPICTTPVPDIVHVEELIHLPLLFHPSPKNVLLISGGIGGVLTEILKHPVEIVEYTELDPLIIQSAQTFKDPLIEAEINNPGVDIKQIDGRLFIKTTQRQYDVVIINLPTPSTLQINRFYTVEFFRMARKILSEDGILVITSPGSLTYMSEELKNLDACIHNSLRKVFEHIRIIPGDVVLFLASPSDKISAVVPDTLIQRLKNRRVDTKLLTDFHIEYKLDDKRVNWFLQSLQVNGNVKINKDLLPSGLFYHLALWNALTGASNLRRLFRLIEKLNLWMFLIPLIAFALILIVVTQKPSSWEKLGFFSIRNIPIPITIATTGFVGMTFDIVLILAFQSFYGYVYHQLGLLVTAFMVGLTAGGTLMIRIMDRIKNDRFSLAKLDLLIALYCVLLPIMLIFFNAYIAHPLIFRSVGIILLFLSSISGFLVGLQFPLANKILLSNSNNISRTAGILYASDLLGACIAGLVASVVFIPVLGIVNTCLLVFLMKLASFALLLSQKNFHVA